MHLFAIDIVDSANHSDYWRNSCHAPVTVGYVRIVAGMVPPRGRESTFLLFSLIALGSLGIGFAAVAPPRDQAEPEGRRTVVGPPCNARRPIEKPSAGFERWQCNDKFVIETGLFASTSRNAVRDRSGAEAIPFG
jgi:hypothetical protein